MIDDEGVEDFEGFLDLENPVGEIRRNILKVVAENPEIEGLAIYSDYLDNEDSKYYISRGTSKSAVYNQIENLEEKGLVERSSGDGQAKPLTLTERGRKVCVQLGINLPKDYPRIFIDTLDELMEPGYLSSDEMKRLKRVLSKELLKTTIEISNRFPVSLDSSSIGISEDKIKNWKINTLEILKGIWVFERENNEVQAFPREAVGRALKRKRSAEEKPSAVSIAQKRECRSELLDLCELLEDLSLRSFLLSEIRNAVKNAYSKHRGKSQPSSKEKETSAAEIEIRKKHAENDLKPELEGLRNWIRKRDVGVRSDVGIRIIERYEPKKEWAFQDLENHVPELMKRIKEFTDRLKELGILNDSFLKMFSNPETVATLKNCVPLSEENEPSGKLTERLKRRGVDVEKGSPFLDRQALKNSEEHIKLFEERLKKMISLSVELEEEREDILERISEILSQEALPGYCSFIKEQF